MRISDWSSDVCSSDLAVQHLRLAVDRCLGGVEVLGTVVVVVELSRAAPDDLAGDVTNGPPEPTPEPVIHAALALRDEARLGQPFSLDLLCDEVVGQPRPPLRRVTDPAVGGRPGNQPPTRQEPTTPHP